MSIDNSVHATKVPLVEITWDGTSYPVSKSFADEQRRRRDALAAQFAETATRQQKASKKRRRRRRSRSKSTHASSSVYLSPARGNVRLFG
jgi:hypothetical protein